MNPAFPVPDYRPCSWCDDLGLVRVTDNATNHKALMKCDCREGAMQTYRLPRWEWKWGKIFHREKCPLDWFKPDDKHHMQHKIIEWKKIVKLYEDYWANQSTEFKAAT